MFFGVAAEMLDVLHRSGRTPKAIVLRMELVPYIDSSGARALEAFVQQASGNSTRVMLCDLQAQPAAILERIRFAGAERAASFPEALRKLAP